MKQLLNSAAAISLVFFVSCNNARETPRSIADHWCELNGKVARSKTDAEIDAAKDKRRNYEKEIEKRYEKDEATLDKIKKMAEECESDSERKRE